VTSDSGGYYPPPGGSYGQPSAPKSKRASPWIIGAGVAALVVVVVTGVVIARDDEGAAEVPRATVVTYEVTGTAGTVEVAYWGPSGGNRPETVSLPWRHELTVEERDALLSISAQTADGSDQELACRISTGGRTLVADRTVTGYVGCNHRLKDG
jgi:hypothetical protein